MKQVSLYNETISKKQESRVHQSKTVLLFPLALICIFFFLSGPASAAYPLAKITNNTAYTVSGTVEYVSFTCSDDKYSVAPGKTWTAKSRGVCLIDKITGKTSGRAKFGENTSIVPYDVDIGTSYSKFQINAYGGRYRIFSAQEFAKVSRTAQGKSPGFRLVNKTQWPVVYSLEQVGCLYYGVLPSSWNGKHGERAFNTGAVWFTLRAHIQPDGISPIGDWDCIKPVAEVVGDVLLTTASAAATAATGGAAAPATGAVVAKIVAKQAIKTAVKVSVKTISKKMAKKVGQYLSEAGTVTMAGQYAGYEWPFRCDKMPEYHITGGPGYVRDEDNNFYLTPESTPFKVTKVNDCGDDMMRASPKSATAKTSLPFPKLTDSTPTTPAAPAPGGQVTVYQHCNFGGYAVNLAPGRYNLQQLMARGVKNDDLSSIKVPNGMSVRAYQHDNFQGQSWNLPANDSCFVNKRLNDVVSSIVITAVDQAQNCYNAIQGKIAWNKAGNKQWSPGNIKNLCAGTKNPQGTINCFRSQIASHGDWRKATKSCAGKF